MLTHLNAIFGTRRTRTVSNNSQRSFRPLRVESLEVRDTPSITIAETANLSPNSGSVDGSTIVVITGSGFTGATEVTFGAVPVSFVVDSDIQITATTLSGTGTVDVLVTNTEGTSANTAADDFTYTSDVPTPPVIPMAPSVTVNTGSSLLDVAQTQTGGLATFSRIVTVELTFNTAITTVDPAAFTFSNGTDTVTNDGEVTVSGLGTNVLTLTFEGTDSTPGVEFHSLADGIWTLTTDLTKVHSSDGAGEGSADTNNIRRLYGDANGTGTVDGGDYGLFGSTFGLNDQDPSFQAQFDANSDGSINGGDFGPFGSRFGTGL